MINKILEKEVFMQDALAIHSCPQNYKNTLYLMNTPGFPLGMCGGGQHALMMQKMYRAFSVLGFNVKEVNSFDGIEDKETNVFICCHPTDGVWGGGGHADFSALKKYEKSFFVLFAFTSEDFMNLPLKNYVLTDFQFKKFEHCQPVAKSYQECSKFVPTNMASFLLPTEIDLVQQCRFTTEREYDCLFIGAPYYAMNWLNEIGANPNLKSFIHIYDHQKRNYLVGKERIEKFLDTNFSLSFQASGPEETGIIPERAFEALSMGLIGVTNSREVSKATNELVKLVSSSSEAVDYIQGIKRDSEKFRTIIESGFDFAIQRGCYLVSCKLILAKLIECGYKPL